MNSKLILIILGLASISIGQIDQQCTSACAANYTFPSNRPTPCCGCCPGAQCHEIPELTVCCNATQSFCGCLDYRAYCSGYIFDTSAAPANGSPFGTCYNPSNPATATCAFSPDPNLWIVCPENYTPCPSSSYYTCCAEGTICTTDEGDSSPNCASATSCTQDYQCASLGDQYGYSYCQNGYCQCRQSFQGASTPTDKCSCQPPSQVVFDQNGNPNCLSPGQCSVGGQNLQYLCADFTDNYEFIQCENGYCQCLPGFQGLATATSKCSCENVQWLPTGPSCT